MFWQSNRAEKILRQLKVIEALKSNYSVKQLRYTKNVAQVDFDRLKKDKFLSVIRGLFEQHKFPDHLILYFDGSDGHFIRRLKISTNGYLDTPTKTLPTGRSLMGFREYYKEHKYGGSSLDNGDLIFYTNSGILYYYRMDISYTSF